MCLAVAMKVWCVLSVDEGVVCFVMNEWCVLSDGGEGVLNEGVCLAMDNGDGWVFSAWQ